MDKESRSINIDDEVKKQAQELCSNDVTVIAMEEFNEMIKNPSKYKRYSSFKDALKDIL